MSAPTGVGATALAIAYARSVESSRADRLFDDPWAGRLAGPGPSGTSKVTEDRYVRPALLHWVAVRTRFLDDFVLGAGCPQLVILGAGLDTRALRLGLPEIRVFEVDTPDVLGYKDSVLGAEARAVPVAADLTRDWPVALRSAGFEEGVPTAWVAEGLLTYLDAAQVDTLVDTIGGLSAPGSAFGATIMPAGTLAKRADNLLGDTSTDLTAAAVRAMWRSESPEDPVGWLAGYGWTARLHEIGAVSAGYGRPIGEAGGTRRGLVTATR